MLRLQRQVSSPLMQIHVTFENNSPGDGLQSRVVPGPAITSISRSIGVKAFHSCGDGQTRTTWRQLITTCLICKLADGLLTPLTTSAITKASEQLQRSHNPGKSAEVDAHLGERHMPPPNKSTRTSASQALFDMPALYSVHCLSYRDGIGRTASVEAVNKGTISGLLPMKLQASCLRLQTASLGLELQAPREQNGHRSEIQMSVVIVNLAYTISYSSTAL
ncbi:hypothetical protein V8C42DRAFT_35166 [Trichoderma barbatum]